jgi:hypothetical protein
MKKNNETLAVYILHDPVKPCGDHGTITLSVVRVLEDGKIRNPGSDHPYEDFVFYAQWETKDPAAHTYGWSAEYRNVYSVELSRAKLMYKTLQKVEKVRGKHPISPTTFGQYVVLMMGALGISKVVRNKKRTSSYDDGEYAIYGIDMAQTVIDNTIANVREPKTQEV